MTKLSSLILIGIILLSGVLVAGTSTTNPDLSLTKLSIELLDPEFTSTQEYVTVELENASVYFESGKPMLPTITKQFTLPFGSKLVEVTVDYTSTEYKLSKKIMPCPTPHILYNDQQLPMQESEVDTTLYTSDTLYPTNPLSLTTGAGIQNTEHVLFLSVHITPQYNPVKDTLYMPTTIEIQVYYEPPHDAVTSTDAFDMVIIAPETFSDALQPLLAHKNTVGVQTFMKTTEDIYEEYQGRDNPEQIKYFIHDAIETHGITYVLLVGDVHQVPMRSCATTVLTGIVNWHDTLSDLYYADIYESNGEFCSWDSNNNNKFGECTYDFTASTPIEILDYTDLYPDVGIGRLPCSSVNEVTSVADKIITYETTTYGSAWFNKIILMSGDTFPNFDNALEGEWLHTNFIGPAMEHQGFDIVKLFTSLNLFSPEHINHAISNGSGFVSYAGHGYTESISTYPPMDLSRITYTLKDIPGMNNDDMLPVVFLDACMTGKLDYDILDKIMIPLTTWLPIAPIHYLKYLADKIKTSRILPYFAWELVTKESGGAIATIAASQPGLLGFAYTNGSILDLIFGTSYINRYFFEAYEPGTTLSNMFIHAQNTYITLVTDPGYYIDDRVTLYEFNVFGDPSLKLGGYPS